MPHIFFLLAVVIGLFYGVFKLFVYGLDTFVLIDERFVSNAKESNLSLFNYFITNDEDETLEEKERKKMKRINTALRFDFIISTLLGIFWVLYPFMLIQLTSDEIAKKSPEDKYIGRWLGIMVIIINLLTVKHIKNGKLFSKQCILLVKLLSACILLVTTLMVTVFVKKLYLSNIINIILTCLWLSNSAVGLFFSYSNKDI